LCPSIISQTPQRPRLMGSTGLNSRLEVCHHVSFCHCGGSRNTDVSALRQFSTTTREHRALRTEPSLKQTSPLSPFQLLVRGARKSILDPVFYALDLSFDPPPPTPLTPDAAAAKKALERAKIMDLKNRRLAGGGSSLTIRRSGDEGVYVRRDLADESEVVDVDMAAADPLPDVKPFAHGRAADDATDGDSASVRKEPSAKSSRRRHALRDDSYETTSTKKKKTVKASKASKAARPTEEPPVEASSAPVTSTSGRKARVKPETYKLAWSVEEQHLLEQLLERFPEGSKNRSVTTVLLCLPCPDMSRALAGYKSRKR
jgi:hypothetical protein